ncbi:cupin domain-containing protein [Anaeromicropila herbilytica]|uniref:Cupin n=1 Tax=Anaeromicropila herbilytica TaxID=2785025 RepID=A0A7R7IDJ2_9FIRM|nr:cupin domain-containing protein [Anaeromicropila herbilytica]BCN31612.1 cupin [Anaeromicropila herbilytica]
MNTILKNIQNSEVLNLKEQIQCLEGQVVSKTIVQNPYVSMTLFAFDKDEEISMHESKGDALIQVLEGTAEITIDDTKYILEDGQSIVMPANHPHAVFGKEKFKMLLVVVFPA